MAVAFRSIGTLTANSGAAATLVPPMPAGWVEGDLFLYHLSIKSAATTPTTPTGWDLVTSVAGGSGIVGIDTGVNRVYTFSRIAAIGDVAAAISLSDSLASPAVCMVSAFSKAVTERWESPAVGVSGGDTTGSATSYSATGSATLALQAGDILVHHTAFNGDLGTPGARTLAVTGVTLGSYVADLADSAVTTGNDAMIDIGHAPYSSGSASAAPTMTRVWVGGSTSFAGASSFLRIRAVTEPKISPSNPARFRAANW